MAAKPTKYDEVKRRLLRAKLCCFLLFFFCFLLESSYFCCKFVTKRDTAARFVAIASFCNENDCQMQAIYDSAVDYHNSNSRANVDGNDSDDVVNAFIGVVVFDVCDGVWNCAGDNIFAALIISLLSVFLVALAVIFLSVAGRR